MGPTKPVRLRWRKSPAQLQSEHLALSVMCRALVVFWVMFPLGLCCGEVVEFTNQERQFLSRVENALESIVAGDQWPRDIPTMVELFDQQPEHLRWEIAATVVDVSQRPSCSTRQRRRFVTQLTQLLNDDSLRIQESAVRWLLNFNASDFPDNSKEIVRRRLLQIPGKQIILLAGKAEVLGLENVIDTFITRNAGDKIDFGSSYWAAMLVKARQGDKAICEQLLSNVASERDLVVKATTLFKDLEYVHKPIVVEYLNRQLNSKARLESSKTGRAGVPVANHAAASLGRMLVGFPHAKSYTDYTQGEIIECRRWMATQESWSFKD